MNDASMKPYLTDAEIADICKPLTQPAAQCKYLRSLNLLVKVKPGGGPLIGRSHFEKVMGGATTSQNEESMSKEDEPDRSAMIIKFRQKKVAHATERPEA